jgi:hypothetical protein
MIGLRSQFGPSLVLIALVALVAGAAALTAARRRRAAGRSGGVAAARVLAVGAVVVTVVATALPRRLGVETDGDLVLRPGKGGLAGWRTLFDAPTSLASLLLVGNVLLYAAVAFALTLGWFPNRRLVVPVCVGLSVLIEAAQYGVLGRVAAIDDVILNATGAGIGYLAAMAVHRWSVPGAAFTSSPRRPPWR